MPTAELQPGDRLIVSGCDSPTEEDRYYYETTFQPSLLKNAEELKEQYNHHLSVESEETEQVADGLEYRHMLLRDRAHNPVHAFLLRVDMQKNTLCVGTPNDDYKVGRVVAKVPDMIDSAVRNGQDVLAAMNADFFDMFGDGHPSGLCVKNGRVVANADSLRPFIGVKKDGSAVIATLKECPDLLGELEQAAAGLEMILKDGALYEWGPLEPFSFVRHPRTAAGLTADGTVLLLEVDGRIPEYSNGASLIEDVCEGIITVLKTTSVVGYIAVYDMTKVFETIRDESYEVGVPMMITTLVYFLFICLISGLFKLRARSARRKQKEVEFKSEK